MGWIAGLLCQKDGCTHAKRLVARQSVPMDRRADTVKVCGALASHRL